MTKLKGDSKSKKIFKMLVGKNIQATLICFIIAGVLFGCKREVKTACVDFTQESILEVIQLSLNESIPEWSKDYSLKGITHYKDWIFEIPPAQENHGSRSLLIQLDGCSLNSVKILQYPIK